MASTPPPEGGLCHGTGSDPRFAAFSGRPTRAPVPATIPSEEVPRLLAALRQQVRDSLARYHFDNARFYAERLFELDASYHHLHLLAHTYVETGGDQLAAAQQMLELHYPFFPMESSQTLSPLFVRRVQASLSCGHLHGEHGAISSSSLSSSLLARDRPSTRADSVDLLSTDDEASRGAPPQSGGASTSAPDLEQSRGGIVDVASRWWCQYVFAVCCARREKFREGAKALHELRGISTTLQSAFTPASLNARAAAEESRGYAHQGPRLTGAMAALYAQDTVVDFFTTMEERLADVDYWLGFCTTRFYQRQDTSEYFFSAARRDPTLLAAFDGYTQHMREPPSHCVEDLFADAAFARVVGVRPVESAVPPPRTNEEADERGEPARRRARHDAASSARLTPSPLNGFVRAYAQVMFLQRSYRCAEVPAALAQLPVCAESTMTAATTTTTSNPLVPAVRRGDGSRTAWASLQRGLAHFHAGQMEESAAAFDHALRAAPWRLAEPALIYYSTALWQLRDDARLGSLAQFLVDKAPFSAVTLCVMANTYSLSKAPHDAIVMLERASHVDPTLAYAHCLRGYELLALGQREEASEAFKSALAIDPRHYMSFAGIGERCLREEQLPEARNCFRLAIAINPLPAVVNRLTATYHRSDATQKELSDALTIYERTIAQHPLNSFAASHQRADVLLRLGRVQEAYTALLALQRQRPGEAVVQVTLARCLQCMGETQQAIMHYQRAMTLDPRREGYVRCALERIASDPMAGGSP